MNCHTLPTTHTNHFKETMLWFCYQVITVDKPW